jgi:hypothetical protein
MDRGKGAPRWRLPARFSSADAKGPVSWKSETAAKSREFGGGVDTEGPMGGRRKNVSASPRGLARFSSLPVEVSAPGDTGPCRTFQGRPREEGTSLRWG